MTKQSHSTWKQMHLKWDWALHYYKPEALQSVQEIQLHATAYSGTLHLQNSMKHRKRYSNIERAPLGILYRLQTFHHYCFIREVSIITDHKH